MMRLMVTLCVVGICVGGILGGSIQAFDKDSDHETIEMVMKKGMKGGLAKKVAGGEATDAEKAELLKMLQAMAKTKAEKGDAESWKKKTTALVVAAQAAVDGKENAGVLLTAAMNCKACHSVHK